MKSRVVDERDVEIDFFIFNKDNGEQKKLEESFIVLKRKLYFFFCWK